MKSRWDVVSLKSEVKLLSGGTPKKSKAQYWDGDIPWVSSGEMTQRHIYDTRHRVTEEAVGNGTRLVPDNTVLVVVRGMSLAKEFRISLTARAVTFNQDVKALQPSPRVDPRFLFYYLQSQRHAIRDSATDASHGTKKIETRVLEFWPLPVPSLEEQYAIRDILFAYDDLIENNRRRIQLLEQAARLLYKEWFVHLRFPGHEHVTITDGVPEGWEKKPFSELATFLNGFAFKPAHLGNVGLPIVKIPELRDGPTVKTPMNTGEHIPEKYLLDNGDILFSWSGTLLVNIWNHGKGLLNQHLFKVTPVSTNLRGLVYFALKHALVEFQNQTTGATMKHIRKGALEKVTALIPNAIFLDEFEATVTPMLEQISVLQRQTTEAVKARDLLLPRLMNGEIEV